MSKRTIVLHSCASKKPSTSAAFSPAARVVLTAIRGYQVLVRPSLIGSCRYLPTCSHYAAEAVARHGALRGALLSLRRLARCHPLGGSGLDPVP